VKKTQLIEQLKQPVTQVDSLLKAMGISPEMETYTDEHLKTLQALNEMLASEKIKTPEDAAQLYRQQRETSTTSEPMDQALATILEEAKSDKMQKDIQNNENISPSQMQSPQAENSEAKLDNFILTLANQAANATLTSFPNIALEEHLRLKALFVKRYRERIAEQLQSAEFRQQFQAAMEGEELGKLPLLSSTTSNTALLNSSSSSS